MRSPVPLLSRQLDAMKGVLAKAEAHARGRGEEPDALLALRLAPDMLPLAAQVRIACDHAKGAAYRLAGREVPVVADDESTLAELLARIDRTLALIAAVGAAEFEGAEAREVAMRMRGGELRMTGEDYWESFAAPNFFFHAATAYGILRHHGVPLGKRDFLGA